MATGWDGIEEFLAVYDRRSFSGAAAALGVSPSHVSRSIVRLEARLNERLFYRTTRSTQPTGTAHTFAAHCRRMIEDRDAAFAFVGEQERAHGALRITCSTAFGERFVAPVVRRFIEEHPGVSAVLQLDNRVVDLIAEGYDLAIRTGNLTDSTLIGTRIASRRLYLCASPAYLDRHGTPKTVADLRAHVCLVGTAEAWRFRGQLEAMEFRPKGPFRCNSGFAVTDAALSGLGICQLPDFYVLRHIEQGALVALLEDQAADEQPVWAVYPHRQHLQAKVRLFIDLLRQQIGRVGPASPRNEFNGRPQFTRTGNL